MPVIKLGIGLAAPGWGRHHRRMNRAGTILLAVLGGLALLAGCGSDSSDGASESSGSETTVSDDGGGDGEASDNAAADDGAGNGVGDDFPIPVPDGGSELPVPGLNGRSIDYAADDFDRIVVFYDEWTASQPQDFIVSESPEAKSYLNDRPTDAEESIIITITRVDDFTNVLVGYDPPPGE